MNRNSEHCNPDANRVVDCKSVFPIGEADDTWHFVRDCETVERSIEPGELRAEVRPLNLPYPSGIFSLSHLAIPFPMNDPLYGIQSDPETKNEFGYSLSAMDTRGERGALIVDQDFLARLSSNPFFPYLIDRVGDGISRPSGPSGHKIPITSESSANRK